jgi:hypothetical protein
MAWPKWAAAPTFPATEVSEGVRFVGTTSVFMAAAMAAEILADVAGAGFAAVAERGARKAQPTMVIATASPLAAK